VLESPKHRRLLSCRVAMAPHFSISLLRHQIGPSRD
jgi:hypothetical protein